MTECYHAVIVVTYTLQKLLGEFVLQNICLKLFCNDNSMLVHS